MLKVIVFVISFLVCLNNISAITSNNNDPSISKHDFQFHYERGPFIVSTDSGSRVNAIIKYNNLNDTTHSVPMPKSGKALQFWATNLCFSPRNFAVRCDIVNNGKVIATKLVKGGGAPCDRVTPANYYRVEFIINSQITQSSSLLTSQNSLQCGLYNTMAIKDNDINNQRTHYITSLNSPIAVDNSPQYSEMELDEAANSDDEFTDSIAKLRHHKNKQNHVTVNVDVNSE